MTGIAIALSFIALYWSAATNFGENEGAAAATGEAEAKPDSNTDGTPPTSDDGVTDGSEFSTPK
jgi:hypothetical protein